MITGKATTFTEGQERFAREHGATLDGVAGYSGQLAVVVRDDGTHIERWLVDRDGQATERTRVLKPSPAAPTP